MSLSCHECGGAFIRNADDTTEHVDENGNRDYDTDRDHVPFSLEEDEAAPFGWDDDATDDVTPANDADSTPAPS